MSFLVPLLEAMRGWPLPYERNFGTFYGIPGRSDLLAKVFKNEFSAEREYANLSMLRSLGDPRLRYPRPEEIIPLPSGDCAVVMEHLRGTQLSRLDETQEIPYRAAIANLVDAFSDHRLYRHDGPKDCEIICLPDFTVGVVDAHNVSRGTGMHAPAFSKRVLRVHHAQRNTSPEEALAQVGTSRTSQP